MEFVLCLGWQLFGDRYWWVSVGLLYKSVYMSIPSMMTLVSRKEIHSLDHSDVNLMVGWKLLISCRNSCSCS